MAKQDTQTAVKPATYVWDLDGVKLEMPLFGPYGDRTLHGTKLEYELVQSNREKRLKGDPDATLERSTFHNGVDYWVTCAWVPEDDARVKAFCQCQARQRWRAHLKGSLHCSTPSIMARQPWGQHNALRERQRNACKCKSL